MIFKKNIPLSEAAAIIRGVSFQRGESKSTIQANHLPVVRAGNIQDELNLNKDLVWVPQKKISEKQQIKKDDLIMCTSSGSAEIVGKCARSECDWQGSFGAFCVGIRARQNICDAAYLYYYLRSPIFKNWSRNSSGANIKNIRKSELEQFSIPLPPLPEQKRIAAILEKADAIRRKRRQAIQLADEFLRSVFLDIFGDPVLNPKRWKTNTLGSIALKFSDGPFGSNLKTSHYVDAGVRVVRLQNIGVDEFLNDDKMYISFGHFRKLIKHKCVPGDLIVGTLGDPNLRVCILPFYITEAINKADCIQFRVDPNQATNEYVCSLINQTGMLTLAYPLMHGQTRTRISMGTLKNLKVPIPPISEQKRFSRVYRHQKKIISKNKKMSLESDNLFVSLTQKVFRGER